MRKFKMIIAAVLLVVILTGVEIYVIRSASQYEPEVEVVFASRKIPEKTVITRDMLVSKKVGIDQANRLSVRTAGDVIGKNAAMDIEDGEMLLSSKVGVDEMQQIKVKDKNNRLFSVEFKGDQANGWWVLVDQYVDIIFVPNETYNRTVSSARSIPGASAVESTEPLLKLYPTGLKKIRVAALIDETGKMLENDERLTLPRYISFEVTDKQAEFLAEAKGRGRLELSVIPEE